MPKTPCRQHRCPNLVSRKDKGYCDKHADKRVGWQARQSKRSLIHSSRPWRRLRAKVLERDDYLCVMCKTNGYLQPATDVDHIINKANGGTDDLNNLQSLCRDCHKTKTQSEGWGKSSG